MWRLLMVGVMLLVTACGDAPVTQAPVEVADLNAIATAGPTVAEVLARGNDSVAAEAPPASFDEIGTWAATPALCEGGRWRFEAERVTTDGETACTIRARHDVSATSKKLELACTSEGLATIERWALNLHEDKRMTVSRTEGGNGVPRSTTLARCGQGGE